MNPGGIMIAPVGPESHQIFQVITKSIDGTLSTKEVASVRYVPLTSANYQMGREQVD